jgi:hypothetical protein
MCDHYYLSALMYTPGMCEHYYLSALMYTPGMCDFNTENRYKIEREDQRV